MAEFGGMIDTMKEPSLTQRDDRVSLMEAFVSLDMEVRELEAHLKDRGVALQKLQAQREKSRRAIRDHLFPEDAVQAKDGDW